MRNLVYQKTALLFLLCVLILVCYWGGTSGGFVFDDIASLVQLGNYKSIDSVEKLKAYVLGGTTGPGGRPVALLTFVANGQTWPANPYYFIVTNIAIHVVNTLLLFWFLIILCQAGFPGLKYKNTVIILACALWALHPFHTSTVLYVVQRMTLLATTFSLLVFISYLYARRELLAQSYAVGILMLLVAALCAGLGFFSKEIVVLLPIQILLIEFFCKRVGGSSRTTLLNWVFWVCLVPSAIVVAGYPIKLIAANISNLITTGSELGTNRSFTMFERLLTEQRILGDYLIDLLIPKMQSAGVFYDGYRVSRSLLNPISTLFWFLLHLGLLLGTFVFRKKYSIVFFCVWWFYAGHLMESTAPMLELKFDHRNYLPSIGLTLLFSYIISCLKISSIRRIVVFLVISVYSILLFMSATLWGNPLAAAMVWVEKNPNSPRALEHAASLHLDKNGATKKVEELLLKSIEVSPKVDAEIKFIGVFCTAYNGRPADWKELAERVRTSARDWSLYPTLKRILNNYISGRCVDLNLMDYLLVLDAYRNNPVYSQTTSIYLIDDLAIKAMLEFDRFDLAKGYIVNANKAAVPLAYQMNRSLLFAAHDDVEYAVSLLQRAILIAESLKNEESFTMDNAKEILQLMQADLEGSEK